MQVQKPKQRVIATENEILEENDPFHQKMAAFEVERQTAIAAGVPALKRLVALCEIRDSGQIKSVARLLAGLYNSHAYPFPLSQLRGLDLDIHKDCLAAIRMDSAPEKEAHEYFEDGNRRFQVIFQKFGIAQA